MKNDIDKIFNFIEDETYSMKSVFCKKCNCSHELIQGLDDPFYWCGNEMLILSPGDIVAILDDDDN